MRVETAPIHLRDARNAFPALALEQVGRPCVFADAPGGTQVPEQVIAAMGDYLRHANANSGGAFLTSRRTDEVVAAARAASADLLGCDAAEIAFGPNMTTLAFSLARAVARTLRPGDEIVVTTLDHDANIAPWTTAARDAGAAVHWVDIDPRDCTLSLDNLESVLTPRTRVVAFTLASNAVGTIPPAHDVVRRVRSTDALVVADAVHLVPHRSVDVHALDVDVLFCSPYKFFGPHLGIAYARRELLDRLSPYKVRPAPDVSPDRWETGTKSHEALAGLCAAVDYLAGLGGAEGPRRARLRAGMQAVASHEARLSERFLEGVEELVDVRLLGITDRARVAERTPTFALRVGDEHPRATAERLGARGIFVWDGNYYALAIMERLGLEDSGGAVRVGFCHYHTLDEVERVLAELEPPTRRGS